MRPIDADRLLDEIESVDWYQVKSGKLVNGAKGEETALYKATDIYDVVKFAPPCNVDHAEIAEYKARCERAEDEKSKLGIEYETARKMIDKYEKEVAYLKGQIEAFRTCIKSLR